MAALAALKDILFSVHAPYYISMSSLEEDKRLNSVNYLLQSAAVCRALGGQRVILAAASRAGKPPSKSAGHPPPGPDRVTRGLFGHHRSALRPCGKIGQLGTLDEVLSSEVWMNASRPASISAT